MPQVTFYTVSDRSFFPATVGLINSLRLTGHRDPVVVLDCGFTARQRVLLDRHATLAPFDRSKASNPTLFKPEAPSAQSSGVVVVVDSDVVVTAPLRSVIDRARGGSIVAVPDPESDRHFPEWRSLFGLSSPTRIQPYVNAGFLALSVDRWPDLLPRWRQQCRRIWSHPTIYEDAPDGPTSQGDQDALNALLMAEYPRDALALLPPQTAPLEGAERTARVVDLTSLRCAFRGHRTILVQSSGRPKPWGRRAWAGVGYGAYVRLLRRVLTGPGVALRLPDRELPPWLRSGPRGTVSLACLRALSSTYASLARTRPAGAILRSIPRTIRWAAR